MANLKLKLKKVLYVFMYNYDDKVTNHNFFFLAIFYQQFKNYFKTLSDNKKNEVALKLRIIK